MKTKESFDESLGKTMGHMYIATQARELADLIVSAIPDLTYERYVKEYKTIWKIALPATALVVIHKFANGGMSKHFVASLSAAIGRTINERNKKEIDNIPIARTIDISPAIIHKPSKSKKMLKVKDVLHTLSNDELQLFIKRMEGLSKADRKKFLNFYLPNESDLREMDRLAVSIGHVSDYYGQSGIQTLINVDETFFKSLFREHLPGG